MSLLRVVIRAKDEAAKIPTTLARINAQTLHSQMELVVVDSGSTDGTVEIARAAGATIIEIPASTFTYGGSLNTGCEGTEAPFIVALSAHAFPPDEHWLERMLHPFSDERVACACGYVKGPHGKPLAGRLVQDLELAQLNPYWGYSNSSGAFRSELWRERPFRADMVGTEDKEWAWHWLKRGMVVVVDPELATEHTHRDEGPLRTYRRSRGVWQGFGAYLDLPPYPARELARDWWNGLDDYPSHLRARIGWRRAAKLAGQWQGRRTA
ncbi:MAG TPA: glycosyltransferase family A protein [Thermoleophilaceae bacterium]|nr:glycosyltransferase family A protein [Thermoleophilaceae bacterium]